MTSGLHPPTNPKHGAPWIDTSRAAHARERLYDSFTGEWVDPNELEYRDKKRKEKR